MGAHSKPKNNFTRCLKRNVVTASGLVSPKKTRKTLWEWDQTLKAQSKAMILYVQIAWSQQKESAACFPTNDSVMNDSKDLKRNARVGTIERQRWAKALRSKESRGQPQEGQHKKLARGGYEFGESWCALDDTYVFGNLVNRRDSVVRALPLTPERPTLLLSALWEGE